VNEGKMPEVLPLIGADGKVVKDANGLPGEGGDLGAAAHGTLDGRHRTAFRPEGRDFRGGVSSVGVLPAVCRSCGR
jgi:hypothetical protein